jgi:predicted TIM-barrel fold metal-dependent hydrolase
MGNLNSDNRLSRRQWLTGVTAVAAASMAPARQAEAQTGTARPHRIDTHHHHSQGGPWTPSRSIEAMDRSGIAAAILSRPAVPVSEPEKARKVARDGNEFAAQVVRDHPNRFGLFATLPLFDVEGSLRETAYGFDVLKADGVCFSTSYSNRWPGDPAFAPVLDELNRRKAVVFIHPAAPGYYNADFSLKIQPAALEFMFDSARAIVSLILNGTLIRNPDIRFIFGHGGGTLPFLHERLDHLIGEDLPTDGEWTTGDNRYRSKYVPNGFVNEMKKVYFDIVRVANPANFALLTQVMPPERLLLGTDYPVVPTGETVGHLPGLHLDGKVLRGIERDNALTLFPRFKA